MKTFTATSLAKELDMTPKRVRAILRQNGFDRPGTRWVFEMSEKSKMKRVLTATSRPSTNILMAKRAREESNGISAIH